MSWARPRPLGQVLRDVAGHLQHIQTRNREDRLERRIRLDDPAVVQAVLLDVHPDLLRHLRARHRLPTADARQRRAQGLRGENANALLLHGRRVLLASGRLRSLALGALLGGDLLQRGLRNRRLRGLRDRRLRRRRLRHGCKCTQV